MLLLSCQPPTDYFPLLLPVFVFASIISKSKEMSRLASWSKRKRDSDYRLSFITFHWSMTISIILLRLQRYLLHPVYKNG